MQTGRCSQILIIPAGDMASLNHSMQYHIVLVICSFGGSGRLECQALLSLQQYILHHLQGLCVPLGHHPKGTAAEAERPHKKFETACLFFWLMVLRNMGIMRSQ